METSFSEAFRAFRTQRGVNQSELARRSGVSLRALGYWEAGSHLPRSPELLMALQTMGAAPQEIRQIMDLLTTPRSLRFLAQEQEQKDGSVPGIGDLLRALRLRQGTTQAELAGQVGVKRHMILRWEAGSSVISGEHLERMCDLLRAAPQERAALRERRLLAPAWEAQDWRRDRIEEATQRWRDFHRPRSWTSAEYRADLPLFELHALAMKRLLRIYAPQDTGTFRLLGEIENDHACWLFRQRQRQEAYLSATRALKLMESDAGAQHFWGEALNLASYVAQGRRKQATASRISIALLEEWLPRMAPGSARGQVLCDIAIYHGLAENHNEAALWLEKAERNLLRAGGDPAAEGEYFSITRTRLKAMRGQPAPAIIRHVDKAANDYQRLSHAINLANDALLSHDIYTARYLFVQARKLLTPQTPPQMQRFFAELAGALA